MKGGGEGDQAAVRALYQAVILEHNRSPRNRGRVDDETHRARGFNPLCGDDVTVSLRMVDGRVAAAGFEGKGCAICTAAASCMTEVCLDRAPEQLEVLACAFESLVTGDGESGALDGLGVLAAFAPVAGFPSRIKCAILPWRALAHALDGGDDVATTENV